MIYLRLLIILSISLLSAITVGSEQLRSAEQLAQQFQEAHAAGDYSRIENLIYWEGVEQKMREDTEKQIKETFTMKIARSYVTSGPTVFPSSDYRMGNKTYGLNLTPVGNLRVEFESPNGIMTVYFVGEINGKYFITLAAPRN